MFRLLSALLIGATSCCCVNAGDMSVATIASPVLAADGSVGFDSLVDRGYTPLFNGKDLSGWRNPYSHGEAKVVDGEIHLLADKKFFLVTDKEYTNFRLSVDIHTSRRSYSHIRSMRRRSV